MLTRVLCALGLVAALPTLGMAQDFDDVIAARVLPGWTLPSGDRMAGIELTLAEGWHTYWRTPGDAGIPPVFGWQGSRNIAELQISWPTPEVYDQNGMRSIVYHNRVVLPVRIAARDADAPVRLRGTVDLGVCDDICIPKSITFDAELPPGSAKPDPRIVSALAAIPYSGNEVGARGVTCTLSPASRGIALRAEISVPSAGGPEVVVIETDNPNLWIAEAQTQRHGDVLVAETRLEHVEGASFAVSRSGLRFTVLGARHAVDIRGCTAK